jgi:hypothetical protein
VLRVQYKFVLVVQNNQHLNLFSTNTVCALKAIPVVCINPSDAYNYLANSYRPYQLRNNKLAATFDGAHGQDAKARDGCFLQRHGGERQPPGRRGALRRGVPWNVGRGLA